MNTDDQDTEKFKSKADSLIAAFTRSTQQGGQVVTQDYPDDDVELLVAEGIRHLTRLISSTSLLFLEGRPAYPYLKKLISLERQFGLPGVDCVYHYSQLHGDYSYLLTGNRGSARVFEIEVWQGSMSQLREWTYFSTTPRSIEPGEDLNVNFSQQEQQGDWIKLPPGECCVLIRQYYYDWDKEQPAHLYIERPDAIYPPPQLTLDDIEQRMTDASRWLDETTTAVYQVIQQYLSGDPEKLEVVAIPFGFAKLEYLRGHYRCQPDEAVILEVKPPEAKYWNFQLGNLQWEALDYHQSCTAVNGHQAVLDEDGILRVVISHRDPGVPNWFDTSGRTLGLISGRYFDSETAPEPTLTKVPFASLSKHLPANTPTVSVEQRQQQMRARQLSSVRRHCGD